MNGATLSLASQHWPRLRPDHRGRHAAPHLLVPQIDPSVLQPVFAITEKAPTRAFSWLKAPSAFTFKTLLRHYAYIRHYANQPARLL